jgi:DNA-binding HxlR family transcriptional regulator
MPYCERSRRIAGVSEKTLRTLERDGLISRTVTPGVPVRVDYRLTELGLLPRPVMRSIKDWAERHIEDVELAQAAYDARPGDARSR